MNSILKKIRSALHVHHWVNPQEDVLAFFIDEEYVPGRRVVISGIKSTCETPECKYVQFKPYNAGYRTMVQVEE